MIVDDQDYWAAIEPFAEDITGKPGTSDEFYFKGIFDRPYKAYGDDIVISDSDPSITCLTSDAKNLKPNDKINVANKEYKIKDVQNDGSLITKLILKL